MPHQQLFRHEMRLAVGDQPIQDFGHGVGIAVLSRSVHKACKSPSWTWCSLSVAAFDAVLKSEIFDILIPLPYAEITGDAKLIAKRESGDVKVRVRPPTSLSWHC